MGKFIIKQIKSMKPQKKVNFGVNDIKKKEENIVEQVASADKEIELAQNIFNENNEEKINEQVMTTSEKIKMAHNVLNDTPNRFKRVKKDKGLIERTESSKTILTEDNKELLND
jgi:actin-related protein